MSLDATRWAWMQQGIRPIHKLILLSLADRAGADDTAYPSQDQLSTDTGADKKTIWQGLKALQEAGLISDAKTRAGSTGQITVWKLNVTGHRAKPPENGIVEPFRKRKTSENGSLPKTDLKHSENGMGKHSENGMGKHSENGIRNLPREPTIGTDQGTANAGGGGAVGGGAEIDNRAQTQTAAIQPHTMPRDWQPEAADIARLEGEGIPARFCAGLVEEFVEYWALGKGAKVSRPGWGRTYREWAHRKWEQAQQDAARRAEQAQKTPGTMTRRPGVSESTERQRGNYEQQQRKKQPGADEYTYSEEFLRNYGHLLVGASSH